MSTTTDQPAKAKMDSRLVLPFVRSTNNVFVTMMKVTPEIGKPHVKEDMGTTHDVSGIIGFSGDIVGAVVVSFEFETAKKLIAGMVGMEMDPSSPDFCDAIGELANMIAGNAKKDLPAFASIAVPTVIIGKGHIIGRLSGVPCIVIPCKTPVGDFSVEVNIKPVA